MKDRIRIGWQVARRLTTDPRIPRPVRWLLIVGLLPIPGPVDELAGGLALAWIAWRRRDCLRSPAPVLADPPEAGWIATPAPPQSRAD